jgi:hypothetical protein
MGKLFGKRRLARPISIWEDYIKVGPMEIGCKDGRWMELAQDHSQWRASGFVRVLVSGLDTLK